MLYYQVYNLSNKSDKAFYRFLSLEQKNQTFAYIDILFYKEPPSKIKRNPT
jgi:hypothetical protein